MGKNYYLGVATCMGLFVPLFGQSFSIFGIHNRLLSLLLLVVVGVGGVFYRKAGVTSIWSFGCYLLLFFVMVIYSDSSQINNLLLFEFSRSNYYESKLSIVFLFTLIPATASFILIPVAKTKSFQDGFLLGMLVLGVAAIFISSMYSEYFFTDSYSKTSEFKDIKAFSRIGITILHMAGVLVSLKYILVRKNTIAAVALFIPSVLFIIIYLQRSSWLYLVFALAYLAFSRGGSKELSKFKGAFILASILAIGLLVGLKVGVFTDSVSGYANELASGGLLNSRMWAYKMAWEGFLDNPMGNGFGSFSLAGYFRYPHNIVLEALYELGLAGGIVLFVFILLSLRTFFAILVDSKNNGDMGLQVIGLLFGYILVVVLKSGDLSSIERMVSFTILFSGFTYRNKSRGRIKGI